MLLESSFMVEWMDDKLLDGDDEWNGDENMMLLWPTLSGSDGGVVDVMEFLVVEYGNCGGGDGGDGVVMGVWFLRIWILGGGYRGFMKEMKRERI
ncbi:hypothetical protein RchiOBHm_Chr5g0060701 [Rosa chinensis]|uniref:Uncharacterized protein n=1 Tax=Rosa chinensis TaxID=74649 RepID=A0A2P6QHR5_ROSCH|nr:hypothetical protein RchiOBHm_Chr5g0060701 [Rosa chinensis]